MASPLEGKVTESEVETLFEDYIQLEVSLEDLNCFPESVDVDNFDNTVTCNINNFSDTCSRDKTVVHNPLTGNYQPQVESHQKTPPINQTKVIEASSSPLSEHNTLSIPTTKQPFDPLPESFNIPKFYTKPKLYNPFHKRKQVCCQQHSVSCPLGPTASRTNPAFSLFQDQHYPRPGHWYQSNGHSDQSNSCLDPSKSHLDHSSQYEWLTKAITANKSCKHPEPITCPFCGCCLCLKEVVTDTPTTDTLVSETSRADNKNQSLPATQRLTETKPNYLKQRKPRRPFKRNTWSVWTREFPLSKKLSGKSHKTTPCSPTDKKGIKWSAITEKLPCVSYSQHNCGST